MDADRKRAQTPSHKQRAHEGAPSPATVAFVEKNGRFGRRREEARAQTPIGEGAIHPQAVAKGVPDLGRFGLHRQKAVRLQAFLRVKMAPPSAPTRAIGANLTKSHSNAWNVAPKTAVSGSP